MVPAAEKVVLELIYRQMVRQKAAAAERPDMAGTTRSRRWLIAAAEQLDNHAEGLLPGLAANSIPGHKPPSAKCAHRP